MTDNLDTLDQQIIDELRRDGRQANTEIARRLGVGETTIRSRVQRLVGEGIIQVAAAVNLDKLGYGLYVLIGVHCAPGRVTDVMRTLSAIQEIRWVSAVSGRWELLITASFPSKEDLYSFITDNLGRMPGVSRAEAIHVLREIKRDYYYWETRPMPSLTSDKNRADSQLPGRSSKGERPTGLK